MFGSWLLPIISEWKSRGVGMLMAVWVSNPSYHSPWPAPTSVPWLYSYCSWFLNCSFLANHFNQKSPYYLSPFISQQLTSNLLPSPVNSNCWKSFHFVSSQRLPSNSVPVHLQYHHQCLNFIKTLTGCLTFQLPIPVLFSSL